MAMAPRRTATDWTMAVLGAIAHGGVGSVSIEGLARELGVTKGSFYWHFADRGEAIEAALLVWEEKGTLEIIRQLREVNDPRQRLISLLSLIVTDQQHGPIDVGLAAQANDPVVGPILQRITLARVEFVADLFVELGFTPAKAKRQARLAVASYLGHFQLQAAMPNDKYLANPGKAYLNQMAEMLLAGPAS